MQFRIELSNRAENEFSRLDKAVQGFLLDKLQRLEKVPDPLVNAARLVNSKNLYRHRFGDYRIIFSLEKDGTMAILLILKVAHRKDDIYKGL